MKWLKNILTRMFTPEAGGLFSVPLPLFWFSAIVRRLSGLFLFFSSLETFWLYPRIAGKKVKQPVYICGLSRSGTTILLQTLSGYPGIATHQYLHMAVPFLPHWWHAIASFAVSQDQHPVDRVHRDGIKVTHRSPEAVEETLWMAYFKGLHDESRAVVLDRSTHNAAFEKFYSRHIVKLLYSQKKTRYLAKNNYNITRMAYILKLFPDARILLTIRNPINHVASFIKQNRVFDELEHTLPRDFKMIAFIGHSEFGRHHTIINTGDLSAVKEIKRLWEEGRHVESLATYWATTYEYIANAMESDPGFSEALLVVPYEQLCNDALHMMDRIAHHIHMQGEVSAHMVEETAAVLKTPDYYAPGFSSDEVRAIIRITAPVAARFGYLVKEGTFVHCGSTLTYPAN